MGGGVLGTAICRELTHRGVETMLLENRWVFWNGGTKLQRCFFSHFCSPRVSVAKNGCTDGTVLCAVFGEWCFPYHKAVSIQLI